MAYFPFFIDLEGREGLIVGGGAVALRKVRNEAEAMAELPLKERGSRVSAALLAAAGEGVSLKLRKRPKKT